jgi:lipid-A-disaccharide synthase
MRYYIIAGEASGDMHAANLVKELKKKDSLAEFRAWGGDLLQSQGATLVKHYRDLAFMGFKEVIVNLGTIIRNIRFCKEDIQAYKPDIIIFVDYPGFNMRIAEWAKKEGFKTVYYISPQVWAWKSKRALKLKRDIDKMITILPFEQEFYRKFDYKVEYVGHPLLDMIDDIRTKEKTGTDKPVVAILPGSRKQEIKKMLPVMLEVAKEFPEYMFVVAGAPGQDEDFYKPYLENYQAGIVYNKTYSLLAQAEAAMVTSGTATLETALFNVPEVVCYKGSRLSYWIGKQLVKIKYISLVNLIMNRLVVKELIQNEMSVQNVQNELSRLLRDETYRTQMLEDYSTLKQKLGGKGASERAAGIVYEFLEHAKDN